MKGEICKEQGETKLNYFTFFDIFVFMAKKCCDVRPLFFFLNSIFMFLLITILFWGGGCYVCWDLLQVNP